MNLIVESRRQAHGREDEVKRSDAKVTSAGRIYPWTRLGGVAQAWQQRTELEVSQERSSGPEAPSARHNLGRGNHIRSQIRKVNSFKSGSLCRAENVFEGFPQPDTGKSNHWFNNQPVVDVCDIVTVTAVAAVYSNRAVLSGQRQARREKEESEIRE
ncbi:hypothetical protein RRG08_024184 [Elysia crispata]|uniref:Uncharacterized protein n=1 Tax=Elysia crispata TaxID=231223 RepID=A0AAE0YQI7_9GAST|nr:hypothetical protein RRG08_024184 [Elysia crispata]